MPVLFPSVAGGLSSPSLALDDSLSLACKTGVSNLRTSFYFGTTQQAPIFNSNECKKLFRSTTTPTDKKKPIIGNYMIDRTIGEGTFGKVKLGIHIGTQEKVAIKILEKDRIADVSDVERVAREIHILKLIRHPNIIQLYEIIETQKSLYLIMEYASGGELFNYIVQRTRINEVEAVKFYH
jgi:serine/threonine protein kinase